MNVLPNMYSTLIYRVSRAAGQHPVVENGGTPPNRSLNQKCKTYGNAVWTNGSTKETETYLPQEDIKQRCFSSCWYRNDRARRCCLKKIYLASPYISIFFIYIGFLRSLTVFCAGFVVGVQGATSVARSPIPVANARFPPDSPLPWEKYPCRRNYRPIHCPRRQRNWIHGPYHAVRAVTI